MKGQSRTLPITICLVDDHLMFSQGLTAMLENTPDIKVIGKAENGRKSIQLIARLTPTVAVIDISLQGMNGLEVAKRVRVDNPQTEILILSMHNNPDYVYRAFQIGCRGYMLKSDSADELKKAIRIVAAKKTYISPEITSDFINKVIGKITKEGKHLSLLTSREEEICSHIIQGRTTNQIATDLCISPKTVRVHVANIMRKLSCRTRTELILRLMEMKKTEKTIPSIAFDQQSP